jgi:hypothetical protein
MDRESLELACALVAGEHKAEVAFVAAERTAILRLAYEDDMREFTEWALRVHGIDQGTVNDPLLAIDLLDAYEVYVRHWRPDEKQSSEIKGIACPAPEEDDPALVARLASRTRRPMRRARP